jgi:hypothetical protein
MWNVKKVLNPKSAHPKGGVSVCGGVGELSVVGSVGDSLLLVWRSTGIRMKSGIWHVWDRGHGSVAASFDITILSILAAM